MCRIHVREINGGQDTAMTPPSLNAGGCAWSPNGRWIAFHARKGALRQVYVASPDGKRLLRLTDEVRPGNGSVDRRLAFLERVYAEDRERWKRNDKRLEHILRVIQREMQKNEERWQKSEERWQKNEERIDAMIKMLYRRAEGQS